MFEGEFLNIISIPVKYNVKHVLKIKTINYTLNNNNKMKRNNNLILLTTFLTYKYLCKISKNNNIITCVIASITKRSFGAGSLCYVSR